MATNSKSMVKNQLYKTVFLTLLGVGCFVGGMYYATEKFDEGLDRVMDEYEVISDKVDVFTKVSDPKTIRLYVRELNKILDDINFLHRLIESGQLADEALTDMLDVQNNIVSKMDSLYSELSLSIISVNEYNTAQDVVDEHTKGLISTLNGSIDKQKKYVEDFNNRLTQLQMKLNDINKDIQVVKESKYGQKIWR